MENIDDFMRQKFDSDDPGERFEFREEYWEQAQALLEKEEDKRRRRFWLIIGLVLAMALLAWLLLRLEPNGSLSQNNAGERDSIFSTPKTEHPSFADGKDTLSGQTTQPSNSREQSNDVTKQGDEKSSNAPISIVPSEGNMPEKKKQGNTRNKSITKTGKSASKGLAESKTSRQNLLGKNDALNVGGTEITQKETAKSDDKSLTTPPITNIPITNLPAEAIAKEGPPITNLPAVAIAKEGPPITNLPAVAIAKEGSPITNHQSLITNSPAVALAKAGLPITIPIFSIPTPLHPMPLSERIYQILKRPTTAKEPIAKKIKPVQDQRFSFGLSLAGVAYKSSDTVGRWAGWTLGAFGDYRLNNNWSLMLGAQARFVPGYNAPGDSSNPNEVSQLRYSFGFQSEEWKRETRGLYYLEVPLSAHWHKGSWSLEAGAASGMLLGVQNRTEYTTESSLEPAKTIVKKFVKGNSEPYNQNYFSAFAGAGYRLNNRISLMTKAQYRFTPVFKTLGEGLKNNGLGNVELGLRLRLF